MVAVLICCALWVFTAWPEGYVAALMAAVFSSFFAAQDDPAPAIVGFLVWSLFALPLAALYLFVLLPAIDGFPMLCLTLAPALIVIGYLQATPVWAPRAIALLIGFLGALSLQATFSADLPEFFNANLAQIVGIAVALATTRLMRSVGAGWAAQRILKRGWREVAALAHRSLKPDEDAWIAAMLDRVGLVAARAALADMRVGLNILHLEAEATRTPGPRDTLFDDILAAVAAAFEHRLADPQAKPAAALLHAIDRAITALALKAGTETGARGFAALTGLRRNLFPAAAPYAPPHARAA
jgi:uncharacterized membrane protein YccC